jgi:hypothetical protein
MRNHCGSPCATFSAYDYTGQEIWNLEGRTGGFVAFAPQGDFMINIGRFNLDNATPESPQNRLAFVDEINLTTGEVNIIWQITGQGDDYFIPFFFPTISTNEQFITFNYGASYPSATLAGNLYIIDRLGNEYRLFSNAVVQDWRPNGGLTFIDILETGENRLVYDPLDADFETVFTTPPGVEILGDFMTPSSTGKWSPDGRYFPFATWNPETETGQLYLWQPEHGDPALILTTESGHSAANFLWTPDASSLYFTTGEGYANNDTLWRFDISD